MHVRRPVQPCVAGDARELAMHGWRRPRTDACAPSSHVWLETRAVKPRTARGRLTLLHVSPPAMHGYT
jgi:hypothetical protein